MQILSHTRSVAENESNREQTVKCRVRDIKPHQIFHRNHPKSLLSLRPSLLLVDAEDLLLLADAEDPLLLADAEDLDLEVERGVGRDAPGGEAAGAVALVRRDDEPRLLAERHGHTALVPAGDHLLQAHLERERLLARVGRAADRPTESGSDRLVFGLSTMHSWLLQPIVNEIKRSGQTAANNGCPAAAAAPACPTAVQGYDRDKGTQSPEIKVMHTRW